MTTEPNGKALVDCSSEEDGETVPGLIPANANLDDTSFASPSSMASTKPVDGIGKDFS